MTLKTKSQLKSRLEANLASRDPVRKPASLCKEVEAGKLASTGASSTLFGILKKSLLENTCEDEEGVAAGGVGAAWRGEGAPMRRGETMLLPPMSIAMFTCST